MESADEHAAAAMIMII